MLLNRSLHSLIVITSLVYGGLSLAVTETPPADPPQAPPATNEIPAQTPANNDIALFSKIDELVQAGVTGLALRMLEKNQPAFDAQQVDAWLQWEKKRIQLMQQLGMWEALVQRIEENSRLLKEYDPGSNELHWFYTQQIRAQLQNGEHELALQKLRRLLWNMEDEVTPETFAQWRRLVIRAYLNLNQVQDAQQAMRRFMQDYGDMPGDDELQWKMTQAQLFLRGGYAADAVRVLDQLEAAQVKPLMLLAKFRARQLSADEVDKQIRSWLKKTKADVSLQRLYWYVLLSLADARQDDVSRVIALEHLLQHRGIASLAEIFPEARNSVHGDALWQAYETLGSGLANARKLLRGDDEAWYVMASNLFEKDAVHARALFAVLALNARQDLHQQLAMQQLMLLLDKETDGLEIIQQLFVHSRRIDDITRVPAEVRYRLVDYALARADLKAAAQLMEQLQQPPAGEDQFSWSLRRARVLILGGQYDEGGDVLKNLLLQTRSLLPEQIDQYMQVVFDMQNVQQHDQALMLFEQLERFPLSPRLQREITYWKAESWQQKADYETAAVLFLKSAQAIDGSFDPWHHTASFRAAESLAQAELIDDARRQYMRLLRITDNSARKAVIRQRLQQLYLKQNRNPSEVTTP